MGDATSAHQRTAPRAMTAELHHGDCAEVLKTLADCSVDAVVTDPPYELSNDGKASANRVAAEFIFPQHPDLKAESSSECHLVGLIGQVARLRDCWIVPCPATAVPVGSMALNDEMARGHVEIENSNETSNPIAYSNGTNGGHADEAEHCGDFLFELGNVEAGLNAANRIGCGFVSGGLGVGFGVLSSGLPRLFHGSAAVAFSNQDIGTLYNTLSGLVSTFSAAENEAVARLDLSGGTENILSTSAALKFLFLGLISGAKLVRASTRTRRLPAMLQSNQIRIVDDVTNRALTFNLLIHKQNISSKGFMGKGWDGSKAAFNVDIWREVLRVLKPGGYLLSFGGTRTYHRLVCAIEDAGFEIRDQAQWIFGSGFNKIGYIKDKNGAHVRQGWGGSLKPAHEPICVARKPLDGTLAANMLTWETGALNIDGCRVEAGGDKLDGGRIGAKTDGWDRPWKHDEEAVAACRARGAAAVANAEALGRWPANVIHDGSPEVLALFPEANGGHTPRARGPGGVSTSGHRGQGAVAERHHGHGSAARFFYAAKASRKDRDEGLEGFALQKVDTMSKYSRPSEGRTADKNGGPKRNTHPCVKPTALMCWLCRLVTPPAGVVLDPWMGSGSTGKACMLEGFRFIGIEREAEYVEIARARIAAARTAVAANDNDEGEPGRDDREPPSERR